MKSTPSPEWLRAVALGAGLALVACGAGCQVDIAGQTLPSPYYLQDDVQYFPSGHTFKLQNEADAQALYKANQAAQAP